MDAAKSQNQDLYVSLTGPLRLVMGPLKKISYFSITGSDVLCPLLELVNGLFGLFRKSFHSFQLTHDGRSDQSPYLRSPKKFEHVMFFEFTVFRVAKGCKEK